MDIKRTIIRMIKNIENIEVNAETRRFLDKLQEDLAVVYLEYNKQINDIFEIKEKISENIETFSESVFELSKITRFRKIENELKVTEKSKNSIVHYMQKEGNKVYNRRMNLNCGYDEAEEYITTLKEQGEDIGSYWIEEVES